MRYVKVAAALGLVLLVCGWGAPKKLRDSEPDAGLLRAFEEGKFAPGLTRIQLPCTVTVRHSDASFDQKASYVFALKPVLERAFRDAAWEAFHVPRGGTTAAFALEVMPDQSELESKVLGAYYRCSLTVTLRSPYGQTLQTKQLSGWAESPFNKSDVPQAVWQIAYKLAGQYIHEAAQADAVRAEALKYIQECLTSPVPGKPPVQPPPPAPVGPIVKRWGVVIGVSQYAKADGKVLQNLDFAHRDAEAFAAYLKAADGGGFEAVALLTNQEATYEGIRKALCKTLGQAIGDDLVVLYFAGHGLPDPFRPDQYYLLPHDADPNDVKTTGYPMADMFARVRAKRVVVFVDACHAGLALPGQTKTRDLAIRAVVPAVDQWQSAGTFVLAGSDKSERSHEGKQWGDGHGVFTYYILEGLKGPADANGDRSIALQELRSYVSEQVKRATEGAQNPVHVGTLDLPLATRRAASGT